MEVRGFRDAACKQIETTLLFVTGMVNGWGTERERGGGRGEEALIPRETLLSSKEFSKRVLPLSSRDIATECKFRIIQF